MPNVSGVNLDETWSAKTVIFSFSFFDHIQSFGPNSELMKSFATKANILFVAHIFIPSHSMLVACVVVMNDELMINVADSKRQSRVNGETTEHVSCVAVNLNAIYMTFV